MKADDGSEIMEGFICPMCKTDYKNPDKLLQHFNELHSEEKDLISTFRDVFKNAKKKILNENELSRTFENTLKTSKSLLSNTLLENEFYYEPVYQDIGVIRDHVEYFKEMRSLRVERFATQTNKLVIRLDKLLTGRPKDPQQIKLHEQNVSEELFNCLEFEKYLITESSMDGWKVGEVVPIMC